MSKIVKDKILLREDIEINGIIYFIPDNIINKNQLSTENIKLFKLILGLVLYKYGYGLTNEINKKKYENVLNITEKIYVYIVSGQVNKYFFNNIEEEIIKKIPNSMTSLFNTSIIDKLEM
jgi:hypothetical protein